MAWVSYSRSTLRWGLSSGIDRMWASSISCAVRRRASGTSVTVPARVTHIVYVLARLQRQLALRLIGYDARSARVEEDGPLARTLVRALHAAEHRLCERQIIRVGAVDDNVRVGTFFLDKLPDRSRA